MIYIAKKSVLTTSFLLVFFLSHLLLIDCVEILHSLVHLVKMQYFDAPEDLLMTIEEVDDPAIAIATKFRFEVMGSNEVFNLLGNTLFLNFPPM